MNTKREVKRHMVEARKHLKIMEVYLGGFDNYDKGDEIKKALAAIDVIALQYFEEDVREYEDAM